MVHSVALMFLSLYSGLCDINEGSATSEDRCKSPTSGKTSLRAWHNPYRPLTPLYWSVLTLTLESAESHVLWAPQGILGFQSIPLFRTKGIVQPKIEDSVINHRHVVPNHLWLSFFWKRTTTVHYWPKVWGQQELILLFNKDAWNRLEVTVKTFTLLPNILMLKKVSRFPLKYQAAELFSTLIIIRNICDQISYSYRMCSGACLLYFWLYI